MTHVIEYGCTQKKNTKVIRVVNYTLSYREQNFMLLFSRSLQDNFGGKNSYKSIKHWPSYDIMCQLPLLGVIGLRHSGKIENLIF